MTDFQWIFGPAVSLVMVIFGAAVVYGKFQGKSESNEKEIKRVDERVATLEKEVVYQDTCKQCHENWAGRDAAIEKTLDSVKEEVSGLRSDVNRFIHTIIERVSLK